GFVFETTNYKLQTLSMGMSSEELKELLTDDFKNVTLKGLMGMATFTDNAETVRKEFKSLKSLFDKYSTLQTTNYKLQTLSMGMSSDYKIAIEEGSNVVRIGSLLFGERTTKK
ncbi:MAG TPA: alanine racemase, partial [Hanamia sp.]|nr:alanine racemase [Hanamia sp.]